MLKGGLGCVICNSKSFHSFLFKLCIVIVYILKMRTFYFVHIFRPLFIYRGVELRGCLVCVICNSKSFHSFMFKLCIIIVHSLKICTFYFVQILLKKSYFCQVLILDIFSIRNPWACLVYVICNSNSVHSLLYKLCIIIAHTLKMHTVIAFKCAPLK